MIKHVKYVLIIIPDIIIDANVKHLTSSLSATLYLHCTCFDPFLIFFLQWFLMCEEGLDII